MSVVSHNQSLVCEVPFMLFNEAWLILIFYNDKDIKLRQHMETNLAKRTPSIKQMAKKYNDLVQKALQEATQSDFPLHLIPQPLDIAKLFDTDANAHMWMADSIPTNSSHLPPYVIDDNVRQGIAALLVQDRVKEELFRLQQEHHSMINWLKVRIRSLKDAITRCSGL